jgi:hypothetical protein
MSQTEPLPCGQGETPPALSLRECMEAKEYAIGPKSKYPILNSRESPGAMIENDWVCYDDILSYVDPNGKITRGCYVKS